jgi:hypothetical protein
MGKENNEKKCGPTEENGYRRLKLIQQEIYNKFE